MRIYRIGCLAIMLLLPIVPVAAEPGMATSALSPETRAVLIREMQAIDAAMNRIHTALLTGDHATVSREAQGIHDSFVLAQSLSDGQRAEVKALPQEFLNADRALHRLAERLVKAGQAQDPHAERVWFEEMTRACLECHETFAAGRFPGLAPQEGNESKH